MNNSDFRWPEELAPNTVCFTVDVEWAAPPVVDALKALFDDHGIVATFFVTHPDVAVSGHERGLHPNFRRNGDTYRSLADATTRTDDEVYQHVITKTLSFAPEAKGVRSHSLFYDSTLLSHYRRSRIEYDCSYQVPLVSGLRPFWKHHGILEIPTYYADHLDIIEGMTGFDTAQLHLESPGIKVFDFHPNIVYLNAPNDAFYAQTKGFYHDPGRLEKARYPGAGIRTFLLSLMAYISARHIPTAPAGAINSYWRRANPASPLA